MKRVTTVQTTAAEALALRRGCQDYAHVMIAICRAAGLAARYVSGHLLGRAARTPGVEVKRSHTGRGTALMPTIPPMAAAATWAIPPSPWDDYGDVSPVSGVYTAPYEGQLSCSKQAGITFLEFANGETLGYDFAC